MKIYKYNDYNDYVSAQTEANKRKISKIWVTEETIKIIHEQQPIAKNIICHGTRNGKEMQIFTKLYNNANIIGTEISDTANLYEKTIQHDFHEINNDWVGLFDIVYSNSWDHSYDPEKSLSVWRDQLKISGKMYIEQSLDPADNRARASDPLEISENETLQLFNRVGLCLIDTFTSYSYDKHPCKIFKLEICDASI